MSYGSGTVFLPIIRKVLIGTLVLEVGYITYDCAFKPMAKKAVTYFNPKVLYKFDLIFRPSLASSFIKFNAFYFTTYSSIISTENLNRFISHFKSFKPLMERCRLGVLRDLSDYKNNKKALKNCMNNLSTELQNFDVNTLFRILIHCLDMSNKCTNREFNLVLIQTIVSKLQLKTSDSSSNVTKSLSLSDHYELLENEVHFIYLMESFLKLNLHYKLVDYFEYFYMSLNRCITKYSLDDLVRLCSVLGDLYLLTRLDGLKLVLQKSLYTVFDQIDRYKVNVSVYSWIQLVKSVNKCNENYMFKRILPYIVLSLEASPFFLDSSTGFNYFIDTHKPVPSSNVPFSITENLVSSCGNLEQGLTSSVSEQAYKFIKLNTHLLNILLFTGAVDNLHLIDLILQSVSSFLIQYSSPSGNVGTTYGVNQYNNENHFINELLYKRYDNKLFKSPYSSHETIVSTGKSLIYANEAEKGEDNLLYCSLFKLLFNNKIAFVRGLKMAEMYLRTVYPTLYDKLGKNRLLKVARLVKFQNDREYAKIANLLSDNRDLIRTHLRGQPIIVVVDIYYLISSDKNDMTYVELVEGRGKDKKLSKLSEFKLNYLKSLGWKCIKVDKKPQCSTLG